MSGEHDPVLDGITESLRMENLTATVFSYFVIAEWMDETGDKKLFFDSYEDQHRVTTLGLLDFAQTIQRGRIAHDDAEEY